jgi:hypothetical protein
MSNTYFHILPFLSCLLHGIMNIEIDALCSARFSCNSRINFSLQHYDLFSALFIGKQTAHQRRVQSLFLCICSSLEQSLDSKNLPLRVNQFSTLKKIHRCSVRVRWRSADCDAGKEAVYTVWRKNSNSRGERHQTCRHARPRNCRVAHRRFFHSNASPVGGEYIERARRENCPASQKKISRNSHAPSLAISQVAVPRYRIIPSNPTCDSPVTNSVAEIRIVPEDGRELNVSVRITFNGNENQDQRRNMLLWRTIRDLGDQLQQQQSREGGSNRLSINTSLVRIGSVQISTA